ncbi:hypothetical protein O181_005290 [Austropuccinia psidii MF-1]|uniref:L domain-like protein n=1 Tax=Austropuccinia psidii MF-1 TaxID=1389203 RepID=A0A9Q3BI36_9BASI|nr:hypothetical protein [Austropuccinia psidii MF-1]
MQDQPQRRPISEIDQENLKEENLTITRNQDESYKDEQDDCLRVQDSLDSNQIHHKSLKNDLLGKSRLPIISSSSSSSKIPSPKITIKNNSLNKSTNSIRSSKSKPHSNANQSIKAKSSAPSLRDLKNHSRLSPQPNKNSISKSIPLSSSSTLSSRKSLSSLKSPKQNPRPSFKNDSSINLTQPIIIYSTRTNKPSQAPSKSSNKTSTQTLSKPLNEPNKKKPTSSMINSSKNDLSIKHVIKSKDLTPHYFKQSENDLQVSTDLIRNRTDNTYESINLEIDDYSKLLEESIDLEITQETLDWSESKLSVDVNTMEEAVFTMTHCSEPFQQPNTLEINDLKTLGDSKISTSHDFKPPDESINLESPKWPIEALPDVLRPSEEPRNLSDECLDVTRETTPLAIGLSEPSQELIHLKSDCSELSPQEISSMVGALGISLESIVLKANFPEAPSKSIASISDCSIMSQEPTVSTTGCSEIPQEPSALITSCSKSSLESTVLTANFSEVPPKSIASISDCSIMSQEPTASTTGCSEISQEPNALITSCFKSSQESLVLTADFSEVPQPSIASIFDCSIMSQEPTVSTTRSSKVQYSPKTSLKSSIDSNTNFSKTTPQSITGSPTLMTKHVEEPEKVPIKISMTSSTNSKSNHSVEGEKSPIKSSIKMPPSLITRHVNQPGKSPLKASLKRQPISTIKQVGHPQKSPIKSTIKTSPSPITKHHARTPNSFLKAPIKRLPTSSSNHAEQPEQPPKTSNKSSKSLKEMIAQAKQNRLKPSQIGNSLTTSLPRTEQSAELALSPQPFQESWGFQSIENLIEKAHRTGKLNLSTRMMTKVPSQVYSKLISPSSIFHPSNQATGSSTSNLTSTIDLARFHHDLGDATEVPWYERIDLVHLNLSLNELNHLDDPIGGFEALMTCDLHHNQLTSLPASFGLLINLTVLNLSSNQLNTFPIPLLSLVHLKELNLSNNALDQLWPLDWKITLKKQLAYVGQPPPTRSSAEGDQSLDSVDQLSTNPDSSFGRDEFFDQFPSSPKKSKVGLNQPFSADMNHMNEAISLRSSSDPFPSLKKLLLSQNKFQSGNLFGPNQVRLPKNLAEIDISKNPLRGPIEVTNNLLTFSHLVKLNLSGCELGDIIFLFDEEGDYDQLEEEVENGLFGLLTTLDLSHNGIDSLGPLEEFFKKHCSGRQLNYEGLPKQLEKLIGDNQIGDVKVTVRQNFLRDENRRRREVLRNQESFVEALNRSHYTKTEVDSTLAKAAEILTIGNNQVEEQMVEKSLLAKSNEDSSEIKQADEVFNPMKAIFQQHYKKTTFALDLKSKKLGSLLESADDCGLERVDLLDFSQNLLKRIPVQLIVSLSNTLTTLNLSRNQLNDESLRNQSPPYLPELLELNLSSNSFKESTTLIWIDQMIGNKIQILDLRYNQFESDEGIYSILKPDEALEKKRKIKKIFLDDNRISRLEDLKRFAAETRSETDKPKGVNINIIEQNDQIQWLDELGLSNNCIDKLPTILGYLKVERLWVNGNSFRIPLRKIYEINFTENSGKLLKWLQERDNN